MHEFETAVVNEPSVFDPLKFYSMSLYIIVTIPVYGDVITLVFSLSPDLSVRYSNIGPRVPKVRFWSRADKLDDNVKPVLWSCFII